MKKELSKFRLVDSIQERVEGPRYFAQKYWDHIKKGGDLDVF